MNQRRPTRTECAEYRNNVFNKVIGVAGLAFLVPFIIWSLWYVTIKGSIPYGRTMGGITFASDPLSFILYIFSHVLVLMLLVMLTLAWVRTRRRDKIKSAEASNLHIAQISDLANNKKAK